MRYFHNIKEKLSRTALAGLLLFAVCQPTLAFPEGGPSAVGPGVNPAAPFIGDTVETRPTPPRPGGKIQRGSFANYTSEKPAKKRDIIAKIRGMKGFDKAVKQADGSYHIKINGLWGVLSKTGNFLIMPVYDSIKPFHKGRAVVTYSLPNGSTYTGYVDSKGKLVTFDQIGSYVKGMARTVSLHWQNNRLVRTYGYITRGGKMVEGDLLNAAPPKMIGKDAYAKFQRPDGRISVIRHDGKVIWTSTYQKRWVP